MNGKHLVIAAGILITMPSFAQNSMQFSDPRVQRYYEQNRALYQQQAPAYRVQPRMEYRYQNQTQNYQRPIRAYARSSGYVAPIKSANRYKPHLMPDQIDSHGEKVFIFNPNVLTWAAYDAGGNLVRKGHGSGGRGYCPDIKRGCRTPAGSFRVTGKRGAECKSSIYPKPRGGAKMPYCMFFNKNYAVHGSYDVPDYNASHGCVRVYPQDAQWLNHNFMSIGTKVIVRPY